MVQESRGSLCKILKTLNKEVARGLVLHPAVRFHFADIHILSKRRAVPTNLNQNRKDLRWCWKGRDSRQRWNFDQEIANLSTIHNSNLTWKFKNQKRHSEHEEINCTKTSMKCLLAQITKVSWCAKSLRSEECSLRIWAAICKQIWNSMSQDVVWKCRKC